MDLCSYVLLRVKISSRVSKMSLFGTKSACWSPHLKSESLISSFWMNLIKLDHLLQLNFKGFFKFLETFNSSVPVILYLQPWKRDNGCLEVLIKPSPLQCWSCSSAACNLKYVAHKLWSMSPVEVVYVADLFLCLLLIVFWLSTAVVSSEEKPKLGG